MDSFCTLSDRGSNQRISLNMATRLPQVMRDGRPPNLATVWRWATRGIRRRDRRILLETTCVGGRRLTTVAAVDRFIAALSENVDIAPLPAKVLSEHRRAEIQLEA